MREDDIKALAAELASARAGEPKKPGAARKRILYPPASVRRAVRLFHRSGQSPVVFAEQLGVSASSLTRWVADAGGEGAFIPLRVAAEPAADKNRPAAAVTDAPSTSDVLRAAAATAQPSSPQVVVRETVVSFPSDLDHGRVREIMIALRGGGSC